MERKKKSGPEEPFSWFEVYAPGKPDRRVIKALDRDHALCKAARRFKSDWLRVRELKRLEGVIGRLLDQIEGGQAVGVRLKQRQEELDIVRSKREVADEPDLDRKGLAELLQPYGPLVGLVVGDPAVIRQVLRRIGVRKIVVTPEGSGWRFEADADFSRLVNSRRSRPPPPDTPHRSPAVVSPGNRLRRQSRRPNGGRSPEGELHEERRRPGSRSTAGSPRSRASGTSR